MITVNELNDARERILSALAVCDKKIEQLSHPEIYGCCLSRCNSIVIDKSRMMTVTTKNRRTTYEFAPLYPTYFTPEAAARIIQNDVYLDCHGKKIPLEIVGELDYYELLLDYNKKHLASFDEIIRLTQQ